MSCDQHRAVAISGRSTIKIGRQGALGNQPERVGSPLSHGNFTGVWIRSSGISTEPLTRCLERPLHDRSHLRRYTATDDRHPIGVDPHPQLPRLVPAALIPGLGDSVDPPKFQRAIELAPQSVVVLQRHFLYLFNLGRTDAAVACAKRQLELDPLHVMAHHGLGTAFYAARRLDEAEAQLKATIEFAPAFPVAHAVLGLTYLVSGQSERAITMMERAADVAGGSPLYLAALAHAAAVAGLQKKAREVLQRLERLSVDGYVSPVFVSWPHIALGETGAALDCLDRAYEERAPMLICLPWFETWDPLRGEPRFQELYRRMNFPETPPDTAGISGPRA